MNAATKLLNNNLNISYPLPSSREEQIASGTAERPYSNTGERYRNMQVISDLSAGQDIAFIDFLTVTFPARDIFRFDKYAGLEDFAFAIDHYFLNVLGFDFNREMKAGRNGYKNHWQIFGKSKDNKGQPVVAGYFCFGGNNDTICISFSGLACKSIDSSGYSFIREFIEELKGKITRIDLAHDCFNGEIDIDTVMDWYSHGFFKSSSRGKYPSAQHIDDMGSGKGRTFYVGSRESGKYFRAYEKGKQLGDSASKWVRLELEILSKKRGIPYEILEKVSSYLSGGYNCLNFLYIKQSRILTEQKTEKLSFYHLEKYAKQSYGRFIEVMLQFYDGCPDIVVEKLRRDDALPSRLEFTSLQVAA